VTTPVFAIHGVKNHIFEDFTRTVHTLNDRVPGYHLEPVFWGDLGARTEHLDLVVPTISGADTRGDEEPDGLAIALQLALLQGDTTQASTTRGDEDERTGEQQINLVATQAAQGQTELTTTDWEQALQAEWDNLTHLSRIDNPALLSQVGQALAAEEPAPGEVAVRGPVDWARQRIRDIDRGINLAIGASAGKLNEVLRVKMLPDVAEFAGDIAVYQGNRDRIQDRVMSTIRNA
jgi:hypothetical protein